MIRSSSLVVRRATQLLLQDAAFVVHPGERIGLVGRNGCGKSTLFALMRGEIDADAGDLHVPDGWRIASVAQTVVNADRSATDYVLDGHTHLRHLQQQRLRAERDGASGEDIANLEMALEQAGAWQAQSNAQSLLAGLGFTPQEWDQPVRTFSGGWQMRIALARALMAPSELLLLDEPTNHLDLDAMIWLERWLGNYDGTVMMISHDSEFLDSVCTSILHIEHQQITRYKGNYTAFLSQRAERLRQAEIAAQRQSQEAERLQRFIDRFKAKATKAKQAQSRVKALARMQTLAPLHVQADIQLRIPDPVDTPERLLTLKQASVGYATADANAPPILKQIDLRLQAGDRIGVLGVNGAGKSTLIKLIAGELPPWSGEYLPSKTLKVGYFAQHQLEMLDLDATALQHMARMAPQSTEQAWRNYLAQFGFTGDRVNEVVAPFSGGEKARLALALVVWHRPNLLILDEPSNHLDAQTRQALTAALAEYEGSLLLVSHDRHLLRTTVDQFWLVAHGEVNAFDGDLDDYRQAISGLKSSRAGLNEAPQTEPQQSVDRKQQRRQQAQARQQLAALTKPLQTRLQELERELKNADTRLDALSEQLASEQFYQETDSQTRQAVIQEHGQLSQQKEQLEMDCLELMEEIEALEKSHLTDTDTEDR